MFPRKISAPSWIKRILRGTPPTVALIVLVIVGLLFSVVFLWLVLGFLGNMGYLGLIRSGLLLLGLLSILVGVIGRTPSMVSTGLALLLIGGLTLIVFDWLGESSAAYEQISRGETSASQAAGDSVGQKFSKRLIRGFTRKDWSATGITLAELALSCLLIANALLAHRKRWPLDRLLSANMVFVAFFLMVALFLGG